jgi:hypothetical protein
MAAEQLAVSQATQDALADTGISGGEAAARELERLRVSPPQDTTKRSGVEATLPPPLQPTVDLQQNVQKLQEELDRIRTKARDQELFGSDSEDDEPADVSKDVHMLDEPYDPAAVKPRAEGEEEDSDSAPTPPPPGTEPPGGGNVPQGDGNEEVDELNDSTSSESSEASTSSSGSSSSSSSKEEN